MSSLHNQQSVEEMAYVHICLEVNQISQVRPRNRVNLEQLPTFCQERAVRPIRKTETAKLTMLSGRKSLVTFER